ncbi:bifunctional lysylphosphatidylglycerol flippase/synthetase MprF [Bacillus chungangensis]|uniref:Phosphatidylglycerol lysyltransferase n=1 Tax=Bacillus chungangensis TaxID=587633 RepID=A0ABT9WTQ1_9BACI|nr:bifunctional lysylphosphatidylglycerol flippase/synthetase MprF [Bacillus chungangensis]MDQ0176668.1 phosphatidylglycerol lysyltransferase [Bacillus chungangensis]
MKAGKYRRLKTSAKVLISLAVLAFVYIHAKKELANVSIKDAIQLFKSLSTFEVATSIFLGLLAVSILYFYDFFLVRSMKLPLSKWKVFRVSWMANTLNGILGFGGIIGAGLRVMIYKQHAEEPKKVVPSVAMMVFSMLSGLSFLAILVLVGFFSAEAILTEKRWLYIALIGVAAFLPFYLYTTTRRKIASDDKWLGFKFTGVSIVEWLAAGGVAYYTLYLLGQDVPILAVLGIFIISAIAGLISMIPGGFGTFDLMYLIGLTSLGLAEESVLSSLFLYRMVYYFIPFGLGLVFSIIEFGEDALRRFEDKPIIGPAIETSNVLFTLQKKWLHKIPFLSISFLVAITASYFFLYGISAFHYDTSLFSLKATMLLTLFADAAIVAFSILLMLNVKPIIHETQRAFYIAMASLITLAVLILFNDGSVIELLWLMITFFVLFRMKKKLRRVRRVFTPIPVIFSSLFVMGLYYLYYLAVTYEIIYFEEVRIFYSKKIFFGTFLTSMLIFAVAGVLLLKHFKRRYRESMEMDVSIEKIQELLDTYGGTYLSHLAFAGELKFFLSSDEKAVLQFSTVQQKIVVLGDPMGEKTSFYLLLDEVYAKADRLGYDVIFYQTQESFMPMYHDFGNMFFKLGEEALVDLTTFSLSGKKRANLRATVNRFAREGYTFEVVNGDIREDVWQQMKSISKQWLGKKREKSFSVGSLDQNYLSKAPIAFMKNQEGKIVAFSSIMPVYKPGYLSIDLMRYTPNCPSGLMDALFINLFQWAKEKGYHTFNIGMAPLSQVGKADTSFFRERIAAIVYENIQYIYRFSGLRRFKEKYHPRWEARYMVYRKYRSLPLKMLYVGKLINRPKRKKQQ